MGYAHSHVRSNVCVVVCVFSDEYEEGWTQHTVLWLDLCSGLWSVHDPCTECGRHTEVGEFIDLLVRDDVLEEELKSKKSILICVWVLLVGQGRMKCDGDGILCRLVCLVSELVSIQGLQ